MIKIKAANTSGESTQKTKVGVGILLISPTGQFLLRHRISAHGNDTWAPPGGHVDFGEDPVQAAIRETKEEVGIDIHAPTLLDFTSDNFTSTNEHYVTLVFAVRVNDTSSVKNMEPEKCDELRWVYSDELPENIFLPLKNFIKKQGPTGLRHMLAMFPRAA